MRSVDVELRFGYDVHNRTSMQVTVSMYRNLVKIFDIFHDSELISLSNPRVNRELKNGVSTLVISSTLSYDIKRADLDFEIGKLQEKISYETGSYCYSYDILKRGSVA